MGFENGWLARASVKAISPEGDEQVMTLHYSGEGGDIPGDKPGSLQALATRLGTDLIGPYKALFTSSWTVQQVEVQEENDPLNPSIARAAYLGGTAATGNRTLTGQALPRAMCGLAQLRTAYIGRSFRGRIFLAGTQSESDMNGEVWEPSAPSNAQYRWQALLDAIPLQPDLVWGPSTATANLCIYSRTRRSLNEDPYAPHVLQKILTPGVHWLRSRQA